MACSTDATVGLDSPVPGSSGQHYDDECKSTIPEIAEEDADNASHALQGLPTPGAFACTIPFFSGDFMRDLLAWALVLLAAAAVLHIWLRYNGNDLYSCAPIAAPKRPVEGLYVEEEQASPYVTAQGGVFVATAASRSRAMFRMPVQAELWEWILVGYMMHILALWTARRRRRLTWRSADTKPVVEMGKTKAR